jgi:signal transduction histidine kinase
MQILSYTLFLLAGVAITFFILRMRLKKISTDLNLKIEKFASSFSTGAIRKPEKEIAGGGILNEFILLGDKIESIREIKTASIPDKGSMIGENEIARKAEELKTRYDNLQVVNELGQLVTSSLSLEETFNHLFKTINSIMDAAVCELGVYFRRENRWKILSNIDVRSNETNPDLNYKNHMAEWSLHNNTEIFLDDAEKDYSRYVFKPLELSNGKMAQSVMSFPIIRMERECGTLTVISYRKNAFNKYHVEMLRSLLPYTAVAMENALVHQELIATQDQLIQKEKMASIGQLVSGIAHEILNPLNFVNNFSKLSIELIDEIRPTLPADEQVELKSQLVNNLDKISFHGTRAYDIVKSMMMLSGSGKGETDSVNINSSVKEFLDLSYHGFKLKAKEFECHIENSLDDKLPTTEIIPQDFGRVLINIFNNAFYAMNDKLKRLSTSPNNPATFEPVLKVKTSIVNSRIVVSITDNGTGIPDEIKNKVFLPFFTTKPTGEGTGLGLSLSHDIIIKGNRGDLTFISEIGKWTEFRIELPVNQK